MIFMKHYRDLQDDKFMRSDYLEMVIPLGCFSILDWMRLFYPFWINGNGLSVGFLFWVAYLWLMD